MNLTKIEIRNFKSIGGRQAVNLSKGLTVLTGRNGSGKCVAPWTIVEQPWGGVTIESLFQEHCSDGIRIRREDGEHVIPLKKTPLISYNLYFNRVIETSASAIFRKPYDGWLLRIETAAGRTIEATPEHKLIAAYGNGLCKWVEASRLSPGIRIMVLDCGKPVFDILDRNLRKRWCGMVYDIYVRKTGAYATGEGVIVHNSNLIDAIRFALGENNPRLLRTDRLSSLVNDNAGKEAETYVRMTIDNSDFTIPGQERNILIARRMGRDGESTYYINGRKTPKNVVEDIISSAGLSARGYNIILQGEISRLADKNPVERRKEIEQALGLSQYDEKKAEALNNLQQADNNLRVAQARLQEIDRRMLQLERERNILLRRRMIEREIERMQAIINSLEYWRLVRKLSEISQAIEENTSIRNRLEAELAEKQAGKKELMNKMEEVLKTASLATPDAERIRLEYELKDYERQLKETSMKLNENRSGLQTVKKELVSVRKRRSRARRKLARLSEKANRVLREYSSIGIQVSSLLEERKRIQEAYKKHSGEITSITNRLTLVSRELDIVSLEKENSEKMVREMLASYIDLKGRIGLLNKRRIKEVARRGRMLEKLADVERSLTERRKILDNTINTIRILMDSLDAFRMVFAKTSGILSYRARSARGKEVLEVVKNISEKKGLNIYGLLMENIQFPEKFSRAVGSLAGEWMDAILVENSLEMLVLMNVLGGKGIGAKVLTSEGEAVKKEIPAELRGHGIHIMNILKYPKSIEKHVLKLFWNSVLANTVEDALAFVEKGFKAVTVGGEVFTVEGGMVKENVEEEIEGLRTLLRGFSEKASELSKILESLNNYAKPVLSRKMLEATDLRNRLAESLGTIDLHMDELGRQISKLTSEYLEASRRINQSFKKHGAGKIRSLEKEALRLKSLIKVKEERARNIRKRIRLMGKEVSRLEKKRGLVRNRLIEIENVRNNISRRIDGYRIVEKELIDKTIMIRENFEHLLNQTSILNRRRDEIRTLVSEQGWIKQEGEEEGERGELIKTIQNLDKEVEKLNSEINRVKDIERKLLVEKEVNEGRIQDLRSRIPGQPLEVSEDKASSTENYMSILRRELEKVQEVNMLAINQYEQEIDFYRNALERINELEAERRSIQEFMEDIERRKREAFLNGLNKINSYFSSFFNRMAGGEGWLQLEDPEKPFEAGLTVYVKFPDKEARVISGVSGGEKSVAALCLVFAMQKLFPATFYIFDEPDAHLDYVNVERMTELLKEVSKETQIILISLRDVVVSKSDKVIGVYVKNGFSKFIEMPGGKPVEETAIVK